MYIYTIKHTYFEKIESHVSHICKDLDLMCMRIEGRLALQTTALILLQGCV